jgi:uracil-DNA glycosylase family 4
MGRGEPKSKGHSPPTARKIATQAPLLWRLGCSGCPLDKTDCLSPKMLPTLAEQGGILFLAEAPGRDEDENTGRPLTGPSGTLLRSCIPDGADLLSFDNVVNCRPPKNRTPTWHEIECCRPRRMRVIEELKPKLIVGLGGVPLSMVLGSKDLKGLRGRLFAVQFGTHNCWFLPTYHPAFLLYTAYDKRKPLNSKFGFCFKKDIEKAVKLANELAPPNILTIEKLKAGVLTYDGHGQQDIDLVLRHLDEAKRAPFKAIDIETSCLRPYSAGAEILTCAVSFKTTDFAFALDHPEAGWTPDERQLILDALKELLKDDTTKVAHNDVFELEWLISYFGKEVVNHTAWECTMLQSHFIDERRGDNEQDDHASRYQALDFLCKMHFGLAYKGHFKLNKKNMRGSPLGETLIYNVADTRVTLQLWARQNTLLEQEGLINTYKEALIRQPTIALMQHIGVDVDQKAVKAAQIKLGAESSKLRAEIDKLDVIKAYKADHKEFNPVGQDAIKLFRDYLKAPEIVKADGNLSIDKGILDKIDHPLAKLIVTLRNREKLLATYVDCLELGKGNAIYPDGKIHTSFNSTFTVTGRLSSDSPNLQNFSKRYDSWVRGQVVPPPGHIFVAVDYGQLEACTGAMCSKDEYLVKALWEDFDIHMSWAERIGHKFPKLIGGKVNLSDKTAMGKFRGLIKNKMVFPAFYGATAQSIAEYLTEATGAHMEVTDMELVLDEFWSVLSGVKAWQQHTMQKYYELGYVESLTGRREHYPLTRNQALNMPFQGTAAEMVIDAMCRLSFIAADSGEWYLHPVLNIHDDISVMVPEDKLESALEVITKQMLTFDFPWINVPLSIEVSIGKDWANLKSIGKFWSNRDV